MSSCLSEFRPDYGDLAKYPFLDEAGQRLRETGFDWQELALPSTAHVIERAAGRIMASLDGKIDFERATDEIEIMTFLAALLIVKAAGNELVKRKFALSEARRAEKFLSSDMKATVSSRKTGNLITKIFNDLFAMAIGFEPGTGLFTVSVPDYLNRASHFHEEEWNLINRPVKSGLVLMEGEEAVRLIRSELANIINQRIGAMNVQDLPESIRAEADRIRELAFHRYSSVTFTVKEYPPCIKHAIDVMSRGENLPHSARLMLATYMLQVGKPIDEIVSLFRTAPDFNEKITRYQIEHLSGLKGGRTKYSVPSCQKLKNESLCFETDQCYGISNPLQFGRRKPLA